MNTENSVSELQQRLIERYKDGTTDFDREMYRRLTTDYVTILAEDQEWHRNYMSPDKVGETLALSVKAVRRLPLETYTPRLHTPTGFRVVTRYQKTELIEFLAGLNTTLADYSPDQGPLMTPEQVVELCYASGKVTNTKKLSLFRRDGGGPEFVHINSRVCRYRMTDVLRWLEKSDSPVLPKMTMEAFNHD